MKVEGKKRRGDACNSSAFNIGGKSPQTRLGAHKEKVELEGRAKRKNIFFLPVDRSALLLDLWEARSKRLDPLLIFLSFLFLKHPPPQFRRHLARLD